MLDQKRIVSELSITIDKKNIFVDEPMSKHTSFRIGGNADVFLKISSENELKIVLEYAKTNSIPVTIVGNGTNLLVRDKGIRGIVIQPKLMNLEVYPESDKVKIKAGSGVSVARISNIAKENSLTGMEFAVGIPGTLGGAVKMNAGAYGNEMKDVIESTKYMDLDGNVHIIKNNEHKFEYRNSIFFEMNVIILESIIELSKGNIEDIESKMKENMNSRIEKQPIDKPSAGSSFKRGSNYITAKLIDECGLKGYKIGGAQISTKHAGFIVNAGGATSKDIIKLIEYVQDKIYKKYNVKIEPEIQIIGEE